MVRIRQAQAPAVKAEAARWPRASLAVRDRCGVLLQRTGRIAASRHRSFPKEHCGDSASDSPDGAKRGIDLLRRWSENHNHDEPNQLGIAVEWDANSHAKEARQGVRRLHDARAE